MALVHYQLGRVDKKNHWTSVKVAAVPREVSCQWYYTGAATKRERLTGQETKGVQADCKGRSASLKTINTQTYSCDVFQDEGS